ncbi:hypothetical protein OUZ56_002773 [Daphnia magna]|uniref:Spaetzle domain-containing protein n=1 Tax=Daphnia magna TaxID=35525 RepID=A0ABR0A730_9CRUS|nr:hypothetical protein OUZ56_002773 [Daphnia magna]
MHAKSNFTIASVLLFYVALGLILLDGSQCQEQTGGGLRFPNLFGGLNNPFSLSNLFRQQRQPQNQVPPPPPPSPAFSSNPQFSLVGGGQLSPVGAGPNHFLQVPPPVFQQPPPGQPFNAFVPNAQGAPLQQQFAQPQPIGTPFVQQQHAGQFAGPPQQPHQISQPSDQIFQALPAQQQPQLTPVASGFTPSIVFQPPQPFNSNNNLVPNILPIGNIPLQPHPTQIQQPFQQQQQPPPQKQQQPPQQQQQQAPKASQQPIIIPSLPGPPPAQQIAASQPTPPVLLPAQFALSSNTLQHQHHQQRHFLRQGKTISTIHRDSAASASSHSENVIDCGAGNDLGFCATSDKYPRSVVDDTMHRCHDQVNLMYAEVPEDYEALGDSHQPAGVGPGQEGNSTGKNLLPWSWSAYRKESACESELRFIQPHVAQDRLGRWRIIIQTPEFPQRVAIDVCRRVDDVCKVFTDCGRKSRCVQRYSYQPLISLDQDKRQAGQCPSMAIFRFPTSCVCHVEVDKRSQTPSKSNRRNSVANRRP